jgi:crotonobetaine/carnitine-CoA ligase
VALGDRPFLVWEDASERVTTWTYREFDDLVAEVAGHLSALGAGPGRPVVHLALANSPAFVALWLASARIGAAVVPADPQATTPELKGSIARTRPVVGVCAAERAQVYEAAATAGPEVVRVDEADVELVDLRGARLDDPPHQPDPGDPAAIMFTSGTTAAPKGVVVTQSNYAFAGDVMAGAAALSAHDCQLVVLPMFHANAQYYSFASAIAVGARVALMHGFSASGFVHQAARHAATHASLFAAPMRMILSRGADRIAGCRLRHVWFAQNVSDDQYETLTELFGCRPRQLYGMTETIPAVLTDRAVDPLPSSMGFPTLGCTVDLWRVDDVGAVSDGEVGEIVVGGVRGLTLFDGYLDDPATTDAAFEKGWFRTGDLASRDDAGRFFFTGRSGDVLKVAGENVSTVEVEGVLAEHPGVLEAAVVAAPDPIRDEVPVAYVVQAPGAEGIDAERLAAHCAARLAPSKRPRAFHVVEELPRTSVGKIKKFMLKSDAVERAERLGESR